MGTNIDFRYNIDGFLTWLPTGPTDLASGCSYCQVFFGGAVEAVGTAVVLGGFDGRRPVIAADYEEYVVTAVESYLRGYKALGIIPPVMIALSLLGYRGSCLNPGRGIMRRVSHPIDRDVVNLPDVVIDSMDIDVPKKMKAIFDAVWNACGFRRSMNYNEAGEWSPGA